MTNIEVPRTQAFLGLSIMHFCTLAFHACARSLYSPSDPTNLTPHPSLEDIDITSSQFKTLMATLDFLTQTITHVNSSIHARTDHEFSLLQKSGSWKQNRSQSGGSNDGFIFGMIFLGLFWLFATMFTCIVMYEISDKFMLRVSLMACWCANLGLLSVVFLTEGMRWYVYVLGAIWPAQLVVGIRVWLLRDRDVGKVDSEKKKKEEGGTA